MDIQTKLKFMSLYRMVLADGVIEPEEILMLQEIGEKHYGLTPEAIDKIIHEDLTELPMIESNIDKIKFLYDMALIAWSDGIVPDCERKMLEDYCSFYDIRESYRNELIDFLLDCAKENKPLDEVIKNFK